MDASPTAIARELADRRARTEELIDALTREIGEIVESAQLANVDDEHDPEGSTIAYERAKATALLRAARRDLEAIDAAGARVAAGTYGACAGCGGDIGAARLDALPAATTCIRCASAG